MRVKQKARAKCNALRSTVASAIARGQGFPPFPFGRVSASSAR